MISSLIFFILTFSNMIVNSKQDSFNLTSSCFNLGETEPGAPNLCYFAMLRDKKSPRVTCQMKTASMKLNPNCSKNALNLHIYFFNLSTFESFFTKYRNEIRSLYPAHVKDSRPILDIEIVAHEAFLVTMEFLNAIALIDFPELFVSIDFLGLLIHDQQMATFKDTEFLIGFRQLTLKMMCKHYFNYVKFIITRELNDIKLEIRDTCSPRFVPFTVSSNFLSVIRNDRDNYEI